MRKIAKLGLQFLIFTISSAVLLFLALRFMGLNLTYSNESESLPIAKITPPKDYSKLPLLTGQSTKNIIIFNVAGMGINQILATRYRYYGKYGKLNMERMPIVTLVNNSPLGPSLVSSPHAAATAMATGIKAYNGKLSPPGNQSFPTILQQCKLNGFATGVITNSYLTGASTAAFASNVETRNQQREVAQQMIKSKFDLLIGGGNEFYKDNFEENNITGIAYAQNNGYTVVRKKEQLFKTQDSLILGLFDNLYSNRLAINVSFNPDNPTFKELIPMAIKHLKKREKGFFLMVDDEGADYGGYMNRADYLTQHLMKMDEAIGVAIEFALKDKETLILVVSESEAGGMVITGGDIDKGLMTFSWGSRKHTGQMVPLFAFGPGAISFSGLIENTDIPMKILELCDQ